MNPSFYINSVRHLLPAKKAPAVIAAQREIQETATLTKTVRRMWPLSGCVTEFLGAVFAVFYLVAALALGALLFFTVWQ